MVDYVNVDPENFDFDFSLEGKNAVVTGGAQGIGNAIADAFVKKGAKVALFDMSEKVKDVAEEMGDNVFGYVTDVTDEDNVKESVQAAKDDLGQLDILVNAAGIALLAPAEDLSSDDFRKTVEVNLVGPFLVSQAVGNVMIEQGKGGRIINIASQGAIIALDEHVAYNSTKEGLLGQTKVLAAEWAEFNINVNAISPTVILTELGEKAWAGEKGETAKAGIPLKRFGYPAEVAAIAIFLASDATSLITGENIVVDGGNTII
jgi:NAD(P)-dependent dehydrogenase (short-subunit alcohol dehydrogenase family)